MAIDEKDVFVAALALPDGEEREAYLQSVCAGHPALLGRVRELLAAHEEPQGPLDRGPAEPSVTVAAARREDPGSVVGPYKLLELIGEGGMGSVWMAQQTEPVKRLVAVKLIKAGMDSGQVLARFEAERQALALMDHPNIARVFDAGSTPDGRPFFVMELVKGVPITRYCDEHSLTPRQRLELFIPVCQAIQHAHQKGIIHRDIKPSNVLVALYDDRPVPKVIDFGVAKATGQPLTERTLHTGFGAVVGTVEYMSPEQASFNQLDVDTRSDVYSLGVLLYELLTGSPPFSRKELEMAGLLEVLRLIREQEPPKPSTKLSSSAGLPALAATRGTEPKRLAALVRGELDWIVMKALEKDRSRRYETANGLALDVQRYLVDEPVQACPPSLGYRLRKLVRRNKGPVLAAVLVILSLVSGLVASLYFAVQASERADDFEKAKERADDEAGKAQHEKAQAIEARDQARHLVYVTRISPVPRLWREGKRGRVLEILEQLRPGRDEKDLRGWEWHHQWRLCHGALRTLTGHDGEGLRSGAQALAYSPDCRLLASGGGMSEGGKLILWDAVAGRELRRLQGHTKLISGVAFSPDGRTLASISWDSTVRLWDVATGRLLRSLEHKTDYRNTVSFSPDGRQLVSLANLVFGAPAGPGGVAAKSHASVKLWDVASGRELGAWDTDLLALLAFIPDGKVLTVDADAIKLREPATGKELQSFPLKGMGREMEAALSADGSRLALVGGEQLGLWEVGGGGPTRSRKGLKDEWPSHLAFSPDGRHVAWAGQDGTVKVWDLGPRDYVPPATVQLLEGQVSCVAFSPDGLRLAAAGDDGPIRILDAGGSGREMRRARGPLMLGDSQLVIATESGALPFCDPSTGEKLRGLGGHDGGMTCMAVSPDRRIIATGGRDCRVRLWNAANGEPLRSLPGHVNPVWVLAFSPDGSLLVSGDGPTSDPKQPKEGAVRVWDPANGRELHCLRGHPAGVMALAFRPDGGLVSVSHDGTVKMWDAARGLEKSTARVGLKRVAGVALSPDGRFLACAGGDRAVRLWDLSKDREVRAFVAADHHPGGRGYPHAVTFSPDGKRLVAGSESDIRFWDVTTGEEVCTIPAPYMVGSFSALAFSPDGGHLVGRGSGLFAWDGRPLTEELAVEREAIGILDQLFGRPLPRQAVLEQLRTNPALAEPVRRRALGLASQYPEQQDTKGQIGPLRP